MGIGVIWQHARFWPEYSRFKASIPSLLACFSLALNLLFSLAQRGETYGIAS